MKILQIMGGAEDGGAEIFFIDAITALKNKNINQHVIINNRNKNRVKKTNPNNSGCPIIEKTKIY